jgi:hypothetical protein
LWLYYLEKGSVYLTLYFGKNGSSTKKIPNHKAFG